MELGSRGSSCISGRPLFRSAGSGGGLPAGVPGGGSGGSSFCFRGVPVGRHAPGTPLFCVLSRFPLPAARGRLLFRLAGSGSSGRAPRGIPGRGFFRIRAGCLPPRPVEDFRRWKACQQDDSSTVWRFLDAEMPVSGRIAPPTGCFVPLGGPWAGGLFQ